MATLVIGTHNRDKGREIAAILARPDLELLTLDAFPDVPDPIEDGDSFEANAIIKATELADALGRAVVADDSGLEVDALDGRPGIYSARYAGEHGNHPRNIAKVLDELDGVPPEHRTARFRAVAALAAPGRLLTTVDGTFEGVIADAPRGTGGFGYDPIFLVPELGRTCAEMAPDEKHAISHRGEAFRKLRDELPRFLALLAEDHLVKEHAIGIDLGGTNIKGGVVRRDGAVVTKRTIKTEAAGGAPHVIDRIAGLVDDLLAESGVDKGDVAALCVGAPGPLNTVSGVIHGAANLGWHNVALADRLQPLVGLPVFIENDANAAAFGESWAGAAMDFECTILLTLGTGIGGGIVLNGQVWHGVNDVGAELGHVPIKYDGRLCSCGSRGCIEAYAAAPAVAARMREAVEAGRDSSLKDAILADEEVDAKRIYDAAVDGDELSREIIEETGRFLGVAIAGFVNIFNPNYVVLHGGMVAAGDMLLGPLRETMKGRCFEAAQQGLQVVASALKGDAGIVGAAGCAFMRVEEST